MDYFRLSCVVLLLSGCAVRPSMTLSDYKAACESRFPTVAEQIQCTNRGVLTDGKQISPQTQEYMLFSKVIAKRLADGLISEDEARLALMERLNQVQAQTSYDNQRRAAAIGEAFQGGYRPLEMPMPHHETMQTDCLRSGMAINCTSRSQ